MFWNSNCKKPFHTVIQLKENKSPSQIRNYTCIFVSEAMFVQFSKRISKKKVISKKYFDSIFSNYGTKIVLRNGKTIRYWYNRKCVCENAGYDNVKPIL